MATRVILLCTFLAAVCASAAAPQKYSGPRPPKADVPYLLHADNLIETETVEAKEENRKDETVYVVPGASSPARTPLAEPIFLLRAEKLSPEKLELYRLEPKRGQREIAFPKKKKGAPRPLRVSVTKLADDIYRIEANQTLDNGEYSLTPAGSNQTFCFQVY